LLADLEEEKIKGEVEKRKAANEIKAEKKNGEREMETVR
jgi:hypothetical protein